MISGRSGRRRAAPRRAVTDRRGASLIELVVVFSILGAAAAVVLPELSNLSRGGSDQAVREIVSAYRTARDAATTRGVPVSVALELATGAYWVVVQPTAERGADTLRRDALPIGGGVRLLGGRGGWGVTTFDSQGQARGLPVYVSDAEGVYKIDVDPVTAAIDARRR